MLTLLNLTSLAGGTGWETGVAQMPTPQVPFGSNEGGPAALCTRAKPSKKEKEEAEEDVASDSLELQLLPLQVSFRQLKLLHNNRTPLVASSNRRATTRTPSPDNSR
jgi:hypothetical protein